MKHSLYIFGALASFFPLVGCTTAQLASFNQGVAQAQEVCQVITASGPAFVALADVNGVPRTVSGKAADVLAADCAVISAIPAPAGAVATTAIRTP
jgi:hypothetical protein